MSTSQVHRVDAAPPTFGVRLIGEVSDPKGIACLTAPLIDCELDEVERRLATSGNIADGLERAAAEALVVRLGELGLDATTVEASNAPAPAGAPQRARIVRQDTNPYHQLPPVRAVPEPRRSGPVAGLAGLGELLKARGEEGWSRDATPPPPKRNSQDIPPLGLDDSTPAEDVLEDTPPPRRPSRDIPAETLLGSPGVAVAASAPPLAPPAAGEELLQSLAPEGEAPLFAPDEAPLFAPDDDASFADFMRDEFSSAPADDAPPMADAFSSAPPPVAHAAPISEPLRSALTPTPAFDFDLMPVEPKPSAVVPPAAPSAPKRRWLRWGLLALIVVGCAGFFFTREQPVDATALVEQARAANEAGQYHAALELAASARVGGAPTATIDAIEAAARVGPLLDVATGHLEAGRFDEARITLDAATALAPDATRLAVLRKTAAELRPPAVVTVPFAPKSSAPVEIARAAAAPVTAAPVTAALAPRSIASEAPAKPAAVTPRSDVRPVFTARLAIDRPMGAAIVIDGKRTGRIVPAELRLTPGKHTIELQNPFTGARMARRTVDVAAGKLRRVAFAVKAPSAPRPPESLVRTPVHRD